jgi:hypothetical protein
MDKRLPCEMLNRMESQTMFVELQKELINEIALERQAEKFRQLLASKDVVTPGRPFKDARILVEEIAAFEKVLPPEHARRIYDAHQVFLGTFFLKGYQKGTNHHFYSRKS